MFQTLRCVSAGICCGDECFSDLLGDILTYCMGPFIPDDCWIPMNIQISVLDSAREKS